MVVTKESKSCPAAVQSAVQLPILILLKLNVSCVQIARAWVPSNTPAMCEVNRMNGSQDI